MTAQEILDREGFLVLHSYSPLMIGDIWESNGPTILSLGIEPGTKLVVIGEISRSDAKRHNETYFVPDPPTSRAFTDQDYDSYFFYKVTAE